MNQNLKKIILLFFSVMYLLFFGANLLAQECPETMVSYWHLDDATEPFQDYVSSNPGTCANSCPVSVSGVINDAQSFDGIDMGINVAAAAAFDWNAGDSFSIEFWIQRDAADFAGLEVIIGRDDGEDSALQWWVGINSVGTTEFSLVDKIGSGPVETLIGDTLLVDGNWHHIVLVRDGANNQTRLFVDGALDSTPQEFTYPAGFQSVTAPVNIGWLQSGNYNYGGNLDELAIYNGVLSNFEISQHYTDGMKGLGLGYCYDGTPIKIMPLGDSITKGTSTIIDDENYIVGYRQQLFRTLQKKGYSVEFVGGIQAGSLAEPTFDPDHEGHPSWRDDQIAANIYSWLVDNPADIVLLHIGTNDVNSDPADVENILNEIDLYSENIVVLLARIINRQIYSPETAAFNNNVEIMAMARVANGDKIIMVDQEGALLYPYDITDDNLHPTEAGYEKMADTWLSTLERILPTSNPLPVLTFSNDLLHFRTIDGQFSTAQDVIIDTLDELPSDFTITSDASWLNITSDASITPAIVTVSINDNTLGPGLYSALITASSSGYVDAVLEVTLVVTTDNSYSQLLVSMLPDHSSPRNLQDAELAGEVYVFSSPEVGVDQVTFYIDHALYRVENFAPFDFSGDSPFNTIQLTDGEHEITAMIKLASGQNEVISSTFIVNNLLPGLILDPWDIVFSSEEGNLPADQIVYLDTSDLAGVDFTLASSASWLTVSPVTGTNPAAITVSVTDSTLVPGVYNATITAVADGYVNATIAVSYSVTSVGGSVYSLQFSTFSDRSGAVSLEGSNVFGDIYVFTGPDDGVSQVVFSLDGVELKIEGVAPFDFAGSASDGGLPYDTSQIADGPHEISAFITLTDGSSEFISNTFIVNNNIIALVFDSSSIVFSSEEGSLPAEQVVNLGTSDLTGADFTLAPSASWLTVSPVTGTSPAAIAVSVTDSTLAPGVYNATITAIADGYANASIAVSYSVTSIGGSLYSLLISTTSDRSGAVTLEGSTVSGEIYVFTGPDDGVSQVVFSLDGVEVRAEGYAPYDFAGSAVEGGLPYDTTQLADGQHEINAFITLTDGSSELISNTFIVNNNIIALVFDSSSIVLSSEEGSLPADQIINLDTSDLIGVDFTLAPSASWLTVSPVTGTSPAAITVAVTDSTLAPGVYNATITAVAEGYANATIAVRYSVTSIGGSVYSLLISTTSDRSGAVTLEGSTVSGEIYVFTGPDDGVSQVVFFLDGVEVRTEGYAPYDFAGSAADGGLPYDTTQLADGQHEISVLINLTDGSSELISNTFIVNNNIIALVFDSSSIVLSSEEGSLPADQIINLDTSDLIGVDFTLAPSASWLTVSPVTGTSPAAITVAVTDSTLAPGVYNATITAVAEGYANATIAVRYSVTSIGGSVYSLLISTTSDRSGAVTLEGSTVSGEIYVFTGPDDGVSQVVFFLDGVEVRTEGYAPYDFAGSAADGGLPYDTTQLADGQHEISVLINLTDGSSELISDVFTVSN